MRTQPPFQLGGIETRAGERQTIDLPMARLYTHSEVTVPVQVVHGKQAGPTLFLSSTIHGDEINGVEIIRRLLRSKALLRLKGTLLAIPVVNPFGFIQRSRYLPDRRDLNRSFPGSPQGSLASRLAYLFMQEIVSRCTHGIDFHTGSNYRTNLPQIRAFLGDAETDRLARAFGAPMVIHSELRDGSLRAAVAERGIPVLLYEGGESLYFSPTAIRTGVRGTLNVMRAIGMLPKVKQRSCPAAITSTKTGWVRAGMSGIFDKQVALGGLVRKGEVLGVLSDPLGDDTCEVFAPFTGVVIGQSNLPLAHEGDALINLGQVQNAGEAEEALDDFTSGLTEDDFSLEQ